MHVSTYPKKTGVAKLTPDNFESKILLNTENFPPIIMVIANVPKFPDKNNIYPKFFLTNCTPPKYNPIPYNKFPNFPNFF